MIFPFDRPSINEIEMEFMQDLDTWLASSGHWDSFWAKTVRLLDGSLIFKKYNVTNVTSQKLKWVNIDTNTKSKLKIKDNGTKYKFKWPKIPKQNNNNDGIDWRLPLTLKFFTTLNEPHKSYFLTSALYSPQKNLIAPTFETTAQSAAKNGPYGA